MSAKCNLTSGDPIEIRPVKTENSDQRLPETDAYSHTGILIDIDMR